MTPKHRIWDSYKKVCFHAGLCALKGLVMYIVFPLMHIQALIYLISF